VAPTGGENGGKISRSLPPQIVERNPQEDSFKFI
jgi:hypothetical protein